MRCSCIVWDLNVPSPSFTIWTWDTLTNQVRPERFFRKVWRLCCDRVLRSVPVKAFFFFKERHVKAVFDKWLNHFSKWVGARRCTGGSGLTDRSTRSFSDENSHQRSNFGTVSRETEEAKVSGETKGHQGQSPRNKRSVLRVNHRVN